LNLTRRMSGSFVMEGPMLKAEEQMELVVL
jgi:hypothetical protein